MTLRIVKHGEKYRIQSKSWKTLWIWRFYRFYAADGTVTINEYDSKDEAEFTRDWLQEIIDAQHDR